jgi:predicted nicotinamide N-methyase
MCELGAGLGLVAVLIEKLGYTEGGLLVATDGDEPTMSLLIDNKVDNECFFESSYLYWGETEDFLSSYPDKFEVVIAADVIYEEEQIEPLLDTVRAVMRRK